MKSIPELIRETGLPDADEMADWLEREHPMLEREYHGLGGVGETSAFAISGAFVWHETPFGSEKWAKVYFELCPAGAATKEQAHDAHQSG